MMKSHPIFVLENETNNMAGNRWGR